MTDLAGVQTPAAFMEALRDYRALRGKPGYRLMAERCSQMYTATPIREALVSDELPLRGMLRAILNGLQASSADHAAFDQAWHRLALDAELSGG